MSDLGVAADRVGRVETHGADYVPESERHGSPRSLFSVWAGSNIIYLYFVLGSLMVILGLNIWQSILVVVAGNLVWIAVGYLAISGPSSGSPSEVISRAFYGVNGNRVMQILIGWLVGVLYEAINLSVGALAGVALVTHFFGSAPVLLQAAIVIGLALVTFTISVFGHATIVKLAPWFTWILLAALVVLAVFVAGQANFGYEPKGGALSGPALWGVAATCFALIASAPLSWAVGADYSRYLPTRTSARATAFWTGFGGFIPSTGIAILGVLAATAVDMSNPEIAMAKLVPPWFYVVFLLVIIVGSISNNALTAYSTGLALLATGLPWRRSITIIFDAVVAIAVTLYALFISNFLDTLSGLLEVSIAVLAPSMAIYVVDIFLRRNRYDGPALQVTNSSSLYWFAGGFNIGGFGALVLGAIAATFCLNTTFYVGPVTQALGGADISVFVGAIVGGGVYWATQRRRVKLAADTPQSTSSPLNVAQGESATA
ncbi:cytosine permease [Leifsonia shinshuensis]|uniref:purine-cytosine permease family protein n=1 Tax=Leifsonia shinshuensis TaxID=150026 RepID=UPI00285CA80D|nr:cytosine permease [Leifsonia shinshuensis]MDR6972866.1 purine-cytosine permease-like protein [Leifsonia shinshuensis]